MQADEGGQLVEPAAHRNGVMHVKLAVAALESTRGAGAEGSYPWDATITQRRAFEDSGAS